MESVRRPNLSAGTEWLDRGNALRLAGRWDEAITAYARAVILAPDMAPAWANLASAWKQRGRLPAAASLLGRALALAPDSPELHYNHGIVRQDQGALAPAMAAYRRAIALRPDYAEAHNVLGQAHLLGGDFTPGWRHCEWRWPDACPPRPLTVPLWRGGDIAGKTVLLFHEQGLGDTVQFVRYVRPVAARGARVVLAVQPPLAALLRGLPEARVVTAGERLPAVDLQAPLLGVPRLLGTTLATIPAEVPYLRAVADRPRPWLERLAGPGLKVGVAWAGNPRHLKDAARSIPWDIFRALLVLPGIRVVSLQLDAPPAPPGVVDLAPFLADFADTAAALERLDLCISADTAVAHLAGALGRPLWVLLPFMPDWRWLLGRADSPWYPTARLFRQAAPGDWAGVIERAIAALRRMI